MAPGGGEDRDTLRRERCGKDVGTRPYWMGVDQYDPCPCLLPPSHDDDCACDHTRTALAAEPAPEDGE